MNLLQFLTSLNDLQWVMLLLSVVLVTAMLTFVVCLLLSRMSSLSERRFKTNLENFLKMSENALPTILNLFTAQSSTDQPSESSQSSQEQNPQQLQEPQTPQLLALAQALIDKIRSDNNDEKH